MIDALFIYESLNRVEGVIWFAIGLALPWIAKPTSRRQRVSAWAASVGFVIFGVSDFLEAPLRGGLPAWLWAWKIAGGAFLLACRFHYIGWDRFRLGDRYVLFGLACLIACAVAIFIQVRFSGP